MRLFNPYTLRKWMPLSIGVAALLGAATGCTPMKELKPADLPAIPLHYEGHTDTASVGDLSWRDLFADRQLQQLIDTALRRNWDVQAALQRVEMARAGLLQIRGALRPQVRAVASAGIDRWGRYTLNGVGNYDTNLSDNIDQKRKIPDPFTPDFFVGVRSSWELDVWGRIRKLKESAALRMLQTQQGVLWVRTQLVGEVAAMYYELLALDSQREILNKNIVLQQKAVEIMEAQKEGGRATELAVQQFRAQLLNTQGMNIALQQQVTALEHQLNLLLGRAPQPIPRSQSLMRQQLPGKVQAGLPSALLLRRPDIREAELELRALEADVSAARRAFLPALTLTPYVGFNAFSAARLLEPTSLAFGIIDGLSAPIFNRSNLKSDYNRSLAIRNESVQRYQKTTFTAFTEVLTTLSEISNLEQQYVLKNKEAEVLEAAVETANDLYLTGYATYLEVIMAQRSVVDAELALVDNKRNQFVSLIQLYRSLGGGAQ